MNTTDRSLNRSRRWANSRSSTRSLMQRGARVRPVCSASGSSSPSQGGSHRTSSMGARHGAIEMMQLQGFDALDAVILAPLLAGAVGAGDHQPVQDSEEDGALDGKPEAAAAEQLMQHRAASGVAPQAFEQQRRADAPAGELGSSALIEGGEQQGTLRQASGGARQPIEIAAAVDLFRAAEIAEDALFDAAVLADGFDQIDVGVGADALVPDEHGPSIRQRRDWSSIKSIEAAEFSTTPFRDGDRAGKRGITPGEDGTAPDRAGVRRRKTAGSCGYRCGTKRMLHLRARGFAPLTRGPGAGVNLCQKCFLAEREPPPLPAPSAP